ncbi:hypothetical protein QJV44_gp21 [Serratia phage vB_SmaS_Tlacuache]|uniref:Uncharacterized protein n=1 Tax=Serratia phage vB_SmaS_Tlacuache TaxID=2894809 RepID=A0AAE9CE49_9CAUD|nr:hypothetical protein QJV44_gp21 [Serratia phage vB_SmaS_Tlacuache]UGO51435.1 hypothetical protein TLACUACHE_21 [Serratia phage vB_SmaS_Tlacuache]
MSGGLILDMGDVSATDAPYRHLDVLGDNLEYWNIFEGNEGNLSRNLVRGKPLPIVVGTPVWDSVTQSMQFNNQRDFLQLGMDHTQNMSVYAIAIPTDVDSMVVSNYGGQRKDGLGTTTGFSLMHSRSATGGSFIVTQNTNGGADAGAGQLRQANFNKVSDTPNAVMGRFSAPAVGLNGMSVYNMTNGANTGFAYGAGQGPIIGAPPRLGSGYGLTAGLVSRVLMCVVWSRVLGLTELANIHSYFKAEYAAKGIDIGG